MVFFWIMAIAVEVFQGLVESNETARVQAERFPKKRFVFGEIFFPGRAFVGIAGQRGIGKTTLLKQRLKESKHSFYVSLDTFSSLDLFELARELKERYGITELLLDEINYCKDWQQGLKKVFDSLEMRVFFTSSVAIEVIQSKADLSRRVIIKKMHPFSFREFVAFYKNESIEKLSVEDLGNEKKLQQISRFDFLFEEYVSGGLVPAYLEEKNPAVFSNILERIIERDLVFSLNFDGKDIANAKTMLEYIANAGIDDASYSSIAKNVGITKYKAMHYVDSLEKAFVLNPVKPFGTNVLKEPKILFVPPFRLCYLKNKDWMANLGVFREEFFVESMKISGFETYYLKGKRGEKKPDYLAILNAKRFVFEIGGAKKSRVQLSAVREKNKFILTYPANNKNPYRPLLFTGFL